MLIYCPIVNPPSVGTVVDDISWITYVEYVDTLGPNVDAYSSVLINVLLKSVYKVEIDDPPSIKFPAVAAVDIILDLYVSKKAFE